MSSQIFYRAIVAKADDDMYAFFTEDGSNNCWQYDYKGRWIRERTWNYRGTFRSVDEFCDSQMIDKYEETGLCRASRGKIRNMLNRAIKNAVSMNDIAECGLHMSWIQIEDGKAVTYYRGAKTLDGYANGKRYTLDECGADNLYSKIVKSA